MQFSSHMENVLKLFWPDLEREWTSNEEYKIGTAMQFQKPSLTLDPSMIYDYRQ